MYKFAFTYLVKQDRRTWEDWSISFKLLHKNILRKLNCSYKILIFCEGEPNKKIKSIINYFTKKLKVEIILQKISLKSYVKRKNSDQYIKNFPHAADCRLNTSLGYRDMCKFFSLDVFNDINLNQTEYFIRLDTDSYFLSTSNYFIQNLQNFSLDYGFISNSIQDEDKAVSLGFGKCLYNYCKRNHENSLINKNYMNLCQEATLRPKIFYTNFEIVKLSWARSTNHQRLLKHIINAKGIYNFRWGDALIRYYSINLLGASKKELKGCLYKHSGIYDSRNIFTRFMTKLYSLLRGKLYKNNYERKLSILDKLILGLLNN